MTRLEGVNQGKKVVDSRHSDDTMRDIDRTCQRDTSRYSGFVRAVTFPHMIDPVRRRIQRRVDLLKEISGASPRSISLASGMSADAIRDIFRKPDNSITLETLSKLAVGLQTTPEWLAYGIGSEAQDDQPRAELTPANAAFTPARVDGRVQAGSWVEVDVYDDDEGETISAPRDPVFPYARQIAYRVGGDSMNRAEPKPIRDGDYVICAAFEDTGLKPFDGMQVVVQQTRYDGQMRERSVKEVRLFDDRTEFVPRSDNAAHRPIVVPNDPDPNDATTVEILALVRFIFDNVPLAIPGMRRA